VEQGCLFNHRMKASKVVSGLSYRNALVILGGHFSPHTFLRVMTESSVVRWSGLGLKSA